MRSSNRIIRGLDAAELPNWSVELIGSRYENPVDRMMAEIDRHQKETSAPPAAPTEEELRLKEWEAALARREKQLEELEKDTLKQAEERGQQLGYEAGWNAAHNERVVLVQAATTMEEEFERFKSELSEKLLDLAVLVSKKVIGDTLAMHPEQAAELLNHVLESMQLHGKAVTLRAHPNTIRVLEAQFGDQQMLGNLRLIEDPKQLQGGFLLQHPEGEVDATLQTRWLRAIEALGRNNPLSPEDTE
ncbi:FliH/SctL family protein [Limnobacter alexandrii]|jgi:flagellar assembly protein FliH|uniref:FliH/SctL family protein n=1 Tax=Limnobacter alexandrii TaxID=2570352 RepID=UPI001109A9C0|nr:FliH/SctL family protein [Limnobacter alexandrii]